MSSAVVVDSPPRAGFAGPRFPVGSPASGPATAAPSSLARLTRRAVRSKSSRHAAAAPHASQREAVATCRQLLADQHGAVVDAVRFVSARHRLSRDMADELRGRVMLHLASNDYAVLRQWRRECSLHTYLVTVITRVFLDYRNQEWGKAKPPVVAKRLGSVALMLWRLTHRKRLSFDEAVETLHSDHGVTETRDELWAIYSGLPAPSGRYFVDVSELAHTEQPGAEADALVRSAERRKLAGRVEGALARALTGLSADDRLIVKLFFTNGMTRAQIARVLRLDQQRLYPHFLALMSRLHDALTAQAITADDVRGILGAVDLPAGGPVLEQSCQMG